MRRLRPDVRIEPVRGNVDTRLRKCAEGQYDAVLLAAAGLKRLGWQDRIAEILEPGIMCPAVGQGALVVETREGDSICRQLDHAPTRTAVTAERAVLRCLGGGCQVPIGAHARLTDGRLRIDAVVVSPDGSSFVRLSREDDASSPESAGAALGRELLDAGASAILKAVYG